MTNKKLKELQETIKKINGCYQVYNYKLEIRLLLPNGCYFSFITYYQDFTKLLNYRK